MHHLFCVFSLTREMNKHLRDERDISFLVSHMDFSHFSITKENICITQHKQ